MTPETQAGREEPVWPAKGVWGAMPSVEFAEDDVDSFHLHRWLEKDAVTGKYEDIFFFHAERAEVEEAAAYLNALETVRGNQLALALEWGAKLTALEARNAALEGYRLLAIDTKVLLTEEVLPRYAEMLEALLGRGADERNPSVIGELITEWLERFDALLTPDTRKEASDA